MQNTLLKEKGGRKMLTCRICQCNFDPGDLRNGICDDCRYEQEIEQERKQKLNLLMRAESRQVEMEELLNERDYKIL